MTDITVTIGGIDLPVEAVEPVSVGGIEAVRVVTESGLGEFERHEFILSREKVADTQVEDLLT